MKKLQVFLIVFLLLGTTIPVAQAKPNIVKVPNVIGMKASKAAQTLKSAGLKSGQTEVKAKGKAGTVVKIFIGKKEIRPGRPVKKGIKIVLGVVSKDKQSSVSKREKLISVPDLAGLSKQKATIKLKNKGLKLGTVTQKIDSKAAAGTIISQKPRSGKSVVTKTSVNIVIAKESFVTVPDLAGKDEAEARRILRASGLKLGRISERKRPGSTSGTIIEQNPRRNFKAKKNRRIDIVVVSGEATQIPEVVGLDLKEAAAILENQGFRVEAEFECCPGELGQDWPPVKVVKVVRAKGKLRKGMLLTLLVPKPMDPGIGSGYPDLMIVEERMSVTVPDPAKPRKVEVTIPVKNIGTAWAHAFTVRWYKRNQLNILGCSRDITGGLGAGEEAVVTCSPDPYINHGTMNWRAVVDEESEIAGDPPDNNIIRGQVVIAEFALTPDLEIREVTAQAPDPQRMEEPFSIVLDILIQNIGDVPTGPFTLRWYPHENDTGDVGCDIRDSRGLERDETRNYKCTYTYPVFGMMNWKAIVDEDGEVPNDPPGNNDYIDQTLIEREEKPDLVITEAHFEQNGEPVAQVQSGGRFKAVFTVANRGSAAADPFQVIWRFGNNIGLDDCCSTDIGKNLGPGASVTKSFKGLTAPEVTVNSLDLFPGIIDVDPQNVVDEGPTEENNEYDMLLSVKGLELEAPAHAVDELKIWGMWGLEHQAGQIIDRYELKWEDKNENEDGFLIRVYDQAGVLHFEDEETYSSTRIDVPCSNDYRVEVKAYNEAGYGPAATVSFSSPSCVSVDLVPSIVMKNNKPSSNKYGFEVLVDNRESSDLSPYDAEDTLFGKCFKVKLEYAVCKNGELIPKEPIETVCFKNDRLEVTQSSLNKLKRTGLKKKCFKEICGNTCHVIVTVDSDFEISETHEFNNSDSKSVKSY